MTALGKGALFCMNCNFEVPISTLKIPQNLQEEIERWHRISKSIDCLWLDSGAYELWAAKELFDVQSPVNSQGLSVRAKIAKYMPCYYWYYQNQGIEGFRSRENCPVCNRKFTAYGYSSLPQFVCEACQIVTVGQEVVRSQRGE